MMKHVNKKLCNPNEPRLILVQVVLAYFEQIYSFVLFSHPFLKKALFFHAEDGTM